MKNAERPENTRVFGNKAGECGRKAARRAPQLSRR